MNTNLRLKSFIAVPGAKPARRFLPRWLATCAIGLCLSSALFSSTVQMEFVGVNGMRAFDEYVGPYTGTMNGTPVPLFCVDFANEVTFGQQWDASLTPITFGADLTDTRYGTVLGALGLYQQAAWLTLQYESQPASQWGDISATVWQLFSAAGPTPSSSLWRDQARSNYASADYGDFRVVTNTGPVQPSGQVQEFLTRVPSNAPSDSVPEPSTQLTVGLALVGGSWVWRKCRRTRSLT